MGYILLIIDGQDHHGLEVNKMYVCVHVCVHVIIASHFYAESLPGFMF